MQRVAEVVIASVAVADDGAGASGKDLAGVDSFRDPGTQPRHLLRWRDTLRTGHDATMIRIFSP
jgi:hypothetical protein